MNGDGESSLDGKIGDHGYDGTQTAVNIEDVNDIGADAVVVGALRADGHIIKAEAMGLLVVQHVTEAD